MHSEFKFCAGIRRATIVFSDRPGMIVAVSDRTRYCIKHARRKLILL